MSFTTDTARAAQEKKAFEAELNRKWDVLSQQPEMPKKSGISTLDMHDKKREAIIRERQTAVYNILMSGDKWSYHPEVRRMVKKAIEKRTGKVLPSEGTAEANNLTKLATTEDIQMVARAYEKAINQQGGDVLRWAESTFLLDSPTAFDQALGK